MHLSQPRDIDASGDAAPPDMGAVSGTDNDVDKDDASGCGDGDVSSDASSDADSDAESDGDGDDASSDSDETASDSDDDNGGDVVPITLMSFYYINSNKGNATAADDGSFSTK